MKAKITIAYITICLTWGLTWLAISIGLQDFPPFYSATLRFIAASIILTAIVKVKRVEIALDKKSLIIYLFMGICSFLIPFSLVYWGEQYISSGLASVLFAVYPFSVAVFTRIAIPEEKINFYQILSIVIGFAGITVIFSNELNFDFSNQLLGMLSVIGSALMQSVVVVVVKRFGKHLNPLSLNFVPMIIGGLGFGILTLLFEDLTKVKLTPAGVLSILFLAVFGSVIAFTAYYWLLKHVNLIALSLSTFITPIVALAAGIIFMGERLTSNQVTGAIMVLCGILISNLKYIRKSVNKNNYRIE